MSKSLTESVPARQSILETLMPGEAFVPSGTSPAVGPETASEATPKRKGLVGAITGKPFVPPSARPSAEPTPEVVGPSPGVGPDASFEGKIRQLRNRGPLFNVTFKVKANAPGAEEIAPDVWMKQIQPTPDMIASCAENLIVECKTIVVEGMGFYRLKPKNLVEAVTAERFMADITEACKGLMGQMEPTPATFKTAAEVVRAKPRPAMEIKPTRWEGEVDEKDELILALHELALPKEGDWSAFREFTDRCSCAPTVKRWIWTCFMAEEKTGREALVLHGSGNDGKSEIVRSLMDFIGPAGTPSEIIGADDKFALALIVGKRVVSFGDVRNPRPLHGRIMREIGAGATLSYQRKGIDLQQARFHPRIVITTNEEFRIDPNNPSEFSRVRRVNVAPLSAEHLGDRGWAARLAEQWPAFLFECRAEYERSCEPGKDIPITDACRAALSGGVEAIAEEHDYLTARLEFAQQENYITSSAMTDLLIKGGYRGFAKTDAYRWLRSNGAKIDWVERKAVRARVWRGVRLLEEPMFSNGSGSSPVPATHLAVVGN